MREIFFDVDGCLVDKKCHLNMDLEDFKIKVFEAIQKGSRFHINSNRSLDNLLDIYRKFGFNGHIINENGIGVYNPNTLEMLDIGFKEVDKEALADNLSKYEFGNVEFIDTGVLITDPEKFTGHFVDTNRLCFCERTRKYTMTFYPRILENGKVSFELDMLKGMANLLAESYPDFRIETGVDYGNVLMTPNKSSKGVGLRRIATNGRIFSFGDEIGDISMFDVSDFCGAPFNASDKVKNEVIKLKGYVSNQEFTRGAYDFLNHIT
jgi:hydroxymethylpyrimidine pyrophosphatase-like HAD family hydrolase